jgi:hypothetical protein
MYVRTKSAVALVAGAVFLIATALPAIAASTHPRSGRPAGAKPQGPLYGWRGDAFSSDSLGRQSFPNPDRDYSIENLRSHPSGS